MSPRPKLFVAIALPEGVREACARVAQRLEAAGFEARYERPDKYHLTLAFLGYTEAEMTQAICRSMQAVAARHACFALTLDRVGAFPHERRPRVVYLGASSQEKPFRELSRATREAMNASGVAFENDAVAHVTLARVRAPQRPVVQLDTIAPIRVNVDALTLFESLPDVGTTRYVVRASAPLRESV